MMGLTERSRARLASTLLAYLDWPRTVVFVTLCLLGVAGYYMSHFRFDASSETLVVEGDPDLAMYERVTELFGGDDFLFLTFRPHDHQPISRPALDTLERIVTELSAVPGVSGVFSVLDAPLLKSPPVSFSELADGLPTLRSVDVDLAMAQAELVSSPFFNELLITGDGTATAIKIDLATNQALRAATEAREALRGRGETSGRQWSQVNTAYRQEREAYLAEREELIANVRVLQDKFSDAGTLHLGGVPMIAADMIAYVKRDLSVFGGSVIGLMIAALALFFRSTRWVVLPLLAAGISVAFTVGVLGFLDWQATVISSNFVSLLGITTVSLTIHLIVHYRELQHTRADLGRKSLVFDTMREKFAPCFFTALTTMAAFGSLTASGIVPVEDFGWMMCIGILISFLVTFTFFPAALLLLRRDTVSSTVGNTNHFIRSLGELTRWRPGLIVVLGTVTAVGAYFGIAQVSLDNRFAEYFDQETEIYQGMRYIDEQLGGTIPFDVVLSFPPYEEESFDEDDDFFFDEQDPDPYPERYWYSRGMLDRLEQVHRFVAAQPQVGKVLSLTALEDFAREFTEDGGKLSSLEIVAVLGAIPENLHEEIIRPYASPSTGKLRISGRIVESGPFFDREVFRQQIVAFGASEVAFAPGEVEVTGMMVLFNSMLEQLLDSQIDTLVYVLLAVFVMFMLLLRSLPHALLGMIPNTLAAATVIAGMGYTGVPLDMMTTTIAAICIGIGVDDTIHYLHRFRLEYERWGDARVAVSFSHASIGRALYFTSVTVMVGFSVLYFSNFVPTVMFGIWTAVAMALALLANLVLLPSLLVLTHGKKAPDPTVRTDINA
jgi:predicted RND superfamily exporter protein